MTENIILDKCISFSSKSLEPLSCYKNNNNKDEEMIFHCNSHKHFSTLTSETA